MAPAAVAGHAGPKVLVRLWRRLRLGPAPLLWVGLALLALSMPTALLALFDERTFQGVSVWLKPWKFQVSIGVYLLTLALFMGWLPPPAQRGTAGRMLVWAAVVCGSFEAVYIGWQGAWGMASHFNVSTPARALLYGLMGVGAVLLTLSSLVLAVLIARSPAYRAAAPLKLAIVLGLLLTWLLGTGFGAYLSAHQGGHWVAGTAGSDAGGLPIVGWSRTGGDLRVAHFFGIHAMHILPAFAALLAGLDVGEARARAAVWCSAAALVLLTGWTFVQAVGGQPLIAS